MSLIQEALRRQQMEQEGKVPEPPPSSPPPPPPFAPPPVQPSSPTAPQKRNESTHESAPKPALRNREEHPPVAEPEIRRVSPSSSKDSAEEHKHRVLPALAAVLVVLILLAGAAIWALKAGLELAGIRTPWMSRETVVTTTAVPAPPPNAAVSTPGSGTPPVPSEVASQPSRPRSTIGSLVKTAVKDASAVAAGTDSVIEEIATPAETTASTTEETAIATAQPAKASTSTAEIAISPTVATPQQVWPNLTISGVVGNDQKGAVFINGKVVGVNESVQGVRVISIRTQGAMLEYNGETRLVKVGQSVNRAN